MGAIAKTSHGSVEGYEDGALFVFKGIPYAAPPVGGLRWLPPQKLEPWSGLRPAKAFGASRHLLRGRDRPHLRCAGTSSRRDAERAPEARLPLPFHLAVTREALARGIQDAWLAFARSGDPSCEAVGAWPAFSTNSAPTMILDRAFKVENAPFAGELRAWVGVADEVFGH